MYLVERLVVLSKDPFEFEYTPIGFVLSQEEAHRIMGFPAVEINSKWAREKGVPLNMRPYLVTKLDDLTGQLTTK